MKMKCCDNCSCHLCRELAIGFSNKGKLPKTLTDVSSIHNDNFILRGRYDEIYKSIVIVPGPPSDSSDYRYAVFCYLLYYVCFLFVSTDVKIIRLQIIN